MLLLHRAMLAYPFQAGNYSTLPKSQAVKFAVA
jgi:hypothetical protein